VSDPIFTSVLADVLRYLASSRNPGVYEVVVQEALPALAGAAGAATDEQSWVSESAFELLSNVVAAAQPGALGGGFFGALAPSLFARLKATEDRDTLQVRAAAGFVEGVGG
jgi:hypothetical protein